MLLLNVDKRSVVLICLIYFNTSYVVITLYALLVYFACLNYFNTSYVVIKLISPSIRIAFFSYFNTSYVVIKQRTDIPFWICKSISIHLMLLLNYLEWWRVFPFSCISIHLMLLLNLTWLYGCVSKRLISIHLMLLLNDCGDVNNRQDFRFQYILCCY